MELKSVLEFRGYKKVENQAKTKTYYHLNFEDGNGESCKLLYDDSYTGNVGILDELVKGSLYTVTLDYSPKYSSLKVIYINDYLED